MSNPHDWRRVMTIESGNIMVVTDLHGDKTLFDRYRDRFLRLHARGDADYLVLAGDLIHRYSRDVTDGSVEMVLDVLRLREELGEERIIYLLGNHELPHIYNIPLQKGNMMFTPDFEWAMGSERERIVTLFRQLPFYLCTAGGVTVTHAGATSGISAQDGVNRLFNFSHEEILRPTRLTVTEQTRPSLQRAVTRIYGQPYKQLAREYLAVNDESDPRYDDFLIGALATAENEDFDLLWSALFSRCEHEYGRQIYKMILRGMLHALSGVGVKQNVLVTGHIDCRNGHKVVNDQQLRFASGKHALPLETGKFLLWDAAAQISEAKKLVPKLHSIFR